MQLKRRSLLLGALAASACRRGVEPSPTSETPSSERSPVLFVGHGAPTIALDSVKGAPLAAWGRALPKPRALVVVSAHWELAPPTIGTVETRPLKYDFGGFDRALYRVKYPAPGAPEVARRVEELLGPGTRHAPGRKLDHGVWTPLVHMFPHHDVPVLQLSLPSAAGPPTVFELGSRLAPLRDEGVLLMGSGNVTHNLRAVAPDGSSPASWASDFDRWTTARLDAGDADALVDAARKGPGFSQSHPTPEHWLPLLFALGAAGASTPNYPVSGFEFGNLSRRSVQFG